MNRSGKCGDCDFPVDPLEAPPKARVLWLPQDDTSVIVLAEAPQILAAGADSQLATDPNSTFPDDGQDLLFELGGKERVQLLFHGADAGDAPVAALVPLSLEGFDRLESIYRLLAALHGRAVPSDTRLTRQQRARQRRMLQSFDGHRDGATQQEIARVVFRTGRLNRDEWQASSARHAVMSLLRDARALIAGGYRKLLRHRRKSWPD